ncbi:hypothetical protein ACP3TD_15865 [Pseudarthrobacter sp. 1G09]|uniref:hypothetical protein n=1 Tax=Pseudarthrobacter sp. 1G09 TaxID=3416178 RepID=UPI003CFAA63A
MSEILNEELESKESGFSRRRVVAGVAWSLPVIATAIASPAAAASPPGKVEALLDFATSEVATFVQSGKEGASGQNRTGKGPIAFHVKNASGLPSGPIVGKITVTSVATTDPRVGIYTFSATPLTDKSLVTAGSFAASFNLASGVQNGTTTTFPFTFYYTGGKSSSVGKEFTLTVSFSSPAGLPDLATKLTLS